MIKSLYTAAAAMVTGVNRQRALAHNIDNMDTPGFKQILITMDDYRQTAAYRETESTPPDLPIKLPFTTDYTQLGEVGLGVEVDEELSDFTNGAMNYTDEPYDMAIQGQGFFRILTPDGERYTRDGRFNRDANGQLVTVDGYKVLDKNGQPITLPDGEPTVNYDGTIKVDNQVVATLGIAVFLDPETETRRGTGNIFIGNVAPAGNDPGSVMQGYLEASNVNPSQVMTQMVSVARAYEAAQKVVQIQDELLGRSIATLGKIV